MPPIFPSVLAGMLALAPPLGAQEVEGGESFFSNHDPGGNGRISTQEYALFQNYVLLSIDYNENGLISVEEWNNWDPRYFGVSYEADNTARTFLKMARLFVLLDKNDDNALDAEELERGLFVPFEEADASQDGVLNEAEFAKAFRLPDLVASTEQ